jgi:hypothetical protein
VGNAIDVPMPCFAEHPCGHTQHSRRKIEQHKATSRLEARSNEPRKRAGPGPKLENSLARPKSGNL